MDYEKIIQIMVKRTGMRLRTVRGELVFSDEGGAEYECDTPEEIAQQLYDDIEAGGVFKGKKETVESIINHARML